MSCTPCGVEQNAVVFTGIGKQPRMSLVVDMSLEVFGQSANNLHSHSHSLGQLIEHLAVGLAYTLLLVYTLVGSKYAVGRVVVYVATYPFIDSSDFLIVIRCRANDVLGSVGPVEMGFRHIETVVRLRELEVVGKRVVF